MRRVHMQAMCFAVLMSACTGQPGNPTSTKPSASRISPPAHSIVVLAGNDSPRLQDLQRSADEAGVLILGVESLSKEFFAVAGTSLTLPKREAIEVFEYPTSLEAETDAARVSADGYSMDPAVGLPAVQVEWVSPPHFFRQGRTMVVYLGDRRPVLDWLHGIFGDQFAGV